MLVAGWLPVALLSADLLMHCSEGKDDKRDGKIVQGGVGNIRDNEDSLLEKA